MHLDRRPHSTVRVVFMRYWSAKQRKHAVAEHLVDSSTKFDDVGDESFEGIVEQPLRSLRIQVFDETSVPRDVGEQYGDESAFFCGRRDNLVPTKRAESCPFRKRLQARGTRH